MPRQSPKMRRSRFRWLGETTPESRAAFQPWLEKAAASEDPLFFVGHRQGFSGKMVAGGQTLMRIDPANFGVAEIGTHPLERHR
jgi:RimJ/RimL family protein N-acetyltransferase